jgi:hypothetical protein
VANVLLDGLESSANAVTQTQADRPEAPLSNLKFVFTVATLAMGAKGLGAGAKAGGASTNIVYRVIRAEEEPVLGLFAKNPSATYSAEGHIINGGRGSWASQYISTTKNLDVARAWAARSGNRIVGIDLSAVTGRVLDFSTGAGLRGVTAQNFARASAEVLIEGHVPSSAILWVK